MELIGIGTDITECLRIARMIDRHGELFIGRVYTPEEIKYCQNRKQSTQHYAGRWAAKEAILKALGTGWRKGISWRDIEVRKRTGRQARGSRPRRREGGRRAARHRGNPSDHLSLPHPRHRDRHRNGPREEKPKSHGLKYSASAKRDSCNHCHRAAA